ncbi:MAG: hypothetical protein DRI57_25350 [Deltaproteobacteria bacterium]|nr:MAG: hypothetical protein DRI57_25350 [Deltaproteobacteria bacterium]
MHHLKPEEEAHFVSQGAISFSSYFWTHIFNGLNIKNAFQRAKSSMEEFQTPHLDANRNGIGNEEEDFNRLDLDSTIKFFYVD